MVERGLERQRFSRYNSVLKVPINLIIPFKVTLAELEGDYRISAPDLEDEGYGRHAMSLTLKLSSTKRHLWGTFDFGILTGALRSTTSQLSSSKPTTTGISFRYRGYRGSDERMMTFGKDNICKMRFSNVGGQIKISGTIDRSEFKGKKDGNPSENVRAMKGEWRGINANNYEVESASRWGNRGGYRGEERDDGPEFSDTTAGGKESDDEDRMDVY